MRSWDWTRVGEIAAGIILAGLVLGLLGLAVRRG